MNPNPNPNLIPPSPAAVTAAPTTTADPYYSYYPPNPNPPHFSLQLHHHIYADPTSSSSSSAAELRPPGVDSYPSSVAAPLPPQGHALSYTQVDASASGYYLDPNWAANGTVTQYGSDPVQYGAAVGATITPDVLEQLAVAQPGSTAWANFTFQIQGNDTVKKRQKKTKVVQCAYCEVCKVDCNSKDVLDQHKLGKKHKKNLEKLQEAAIKSSVSSATQNPVIGPQSKPNKGKAGSKKRVAMQFEDLETKRRKVVEGGAAQEAVRVCVICNVVCNSDNVYNYHLAGRKHATMLKKHGARMVAAT